MAQKSSPSSADNLKDLVASRPKVDARRARVEDYLARLSGSRVRIIVEEINFALYSGCFGDDSEVIERDLGRKTSVVPFRQLTGDYYFWISLREVWTQVRETKNYRFKNLGITVYGGELGKLPKPQIFRCEWPGVDFWGKSSLRFQTAGAAMPHWQIDSAELFRMSKEANDAEFRPAGMLQQSSLSALDHFRNQFSRALAIPIDRMHFASAAPWWLAGDDDFVGHIHSPKDILGLDRWTMSTLRYLHQELGRCS